MAQAKRLCYLSSMRNLSAVWFLSLLLPAATLLGQDVPRVQVHLAPSVETALGAWRADYANFGLAKVRVDVSILERSYLFTEYGARFGGGVRNTTQILDFLLNEDGFIIGNNGSPAMVRLEGRGSNFTLGYGNRFWMNKGHSFAWELAPAMISHKIWFNNSGGVPMLSKPLVYGLDRLRRGIGLQSGLRYSYFDPYGTINFSLALRGGLVQTHYVRERYYGGNPPSTKAQWDGFIGLEASWYLPLGGKMSSGAQSPTDQPKVRYYQ